MLYCVFLCISRTRRSVAGLFFLLLFLVLVNPVFKQSSETNISSYEITHVTLYLHIRVIKPLLSGTIFGPGRVAPWVRHLGYLARKSGVLGSIPGLVTYFRFSFRFFKKGSCQLLAKVCAQNTG